MREAVAGLTPFLAANAVLGTYRMIYRAVCVGVHYGTAFVLTVPIRVLVANAINSAATFRAIGRFFVSKWRNEPLRWLKTEHEYPTAATLRASDVAADPMDEWLHSPAAASGD
jgi:hypothetical protein